jgi:hypothetical protein
LVNEASQRRHKEEKAKSREAGKQARKAGDKKAKGRKFVAIAP